MSDTRNSQTGNLKIHLSDMEGNVNELNGDAFCECPDETEETLSPGNASIVIEITEDENENIQQEKNDKVPTLKRNRGFLSSSGSSSQGAKFMASIRRRDTAAIKKFQQCNSALYDFCDENGVSFAETAVITNDYITVDVLIDGAAEKHKLVFIRQAMLFTVRDENMTLLKHLLKRLNDIKRNLKSSCKQSLEKTENAEFSTEVTPIILAARLNRLDMIQLLEQAGESDIHPIADSMDQSCAKKSCYVCKLVNMKIMKGTVQEYRHSSEVLQAISSPAYIFSRSPDDPILETFRISQLADRLLREDTAFADSYREIGRGCREFTRDLVSLCRSTEEVKVMLNYPRGLEVTNAKGSRARFPRLQVAIHYAQKPFVAQANCQQVLDQVWNTGLPSWVCQRRFHFLRFVLYSAVLCVLMPFAFLIYSLPMIHCPLNKRVEKIIKTPVGKFIHDMISYMAFVVLIIVASIIETPKYRFLTAVEWCIFIWVAGLTARWIKVMYYRRAQIMNCHSLMPTDRSWFIDDILMLLAFWVSFVFRILHWADIYMHSPSDCYTASEEAFSVASIVSIMRLLAFFKSADYMGPLIVSLKSIMFPILRFMIIFVLILLAFVIGLSHIHTNHNIPQQGPGDTKIKRIYNNLFWNLFGYEEPMTLDRELLLEDIEVNSTTTSMTSQIIGTTLLGAYHVIAIIVLANILIAMVTNTYNRIERNSDEEWKFARTQLRMSYFNEVGCLPPPFNLLPSRKIIKGIKKIIRKMTCCCEKKEYNPEEAWKKCHSPAHAHTALMEKLRRRYRKMKATGEEAKPTDSLLMRLSSRNEEKTELFPHIRNPLDHHTDIAKENIQGHDYKIDNVTDRDTNV